MKEARINPKGINVEYTPERIDAFVKTAREEADNFGKLFDGYRNKVQMYTIGDVMDNPTNAIQLQEKIKQAEEIAKSKFNKYFNVVDKYDFLDRPDNVKELENENYRIDTYADMFYYLSDALDSILSAVKQLKKVQ